MKTTFFSTLSFLLLYIISVFLLVAGFIANIWQSADPTWFYNFEIDMESHILGRLVQSRQSSIFSYGGLTGLGSQNTIPNELTERYYFTRPFVEQYQTYFDNGNFRTFVVYKSQIGGQGIFFSLLDQYIRIQPSTKLLLFQVIDSLLLGLVLTNIIWWFNAEFRFTVALVAWVSLLASSWLTVFGRNLWWSTWAFYMPMSAVFFYLKSETVPDNLNIKKLSAIVFTTTLIKCIFNGYEYITTTFVMTCVPIVYYFIRQQSKVSNLFYALVAIGVGAFLAILLSFVMLSAQIASVEGDMTKGITHILDSFQRRAYALNPGDFPSEEASLRSSLRQVLDMYVFNSFFTSRNFSFQGKDIIIEIRYSELIIAFAIVSVLLYSRRLFSSSRQDSKIEQQKQNALLGATWFSILAPLSWFIVFKAHSYLHPHMNYIVWQMPFTIMGFAVVGFFIGKVWDDFKYTIS